jgi:L-alanine-DL-glutamate epimerase-like enolase superfamily enzyme
MLREASTYSFHTRRTHSLQKPYDIGDGLLHIPDVPGIGLEWNEDVVAASRFDL